MYEFYSSNTLITGNDNLFQLIMSYWETNDDKSRI